MSVQIEFLKRCKTLGLHDSNLPAWLDEIESLRAKVVELEQKNARLRFGLADTEALELGTAERCKRWRESYKLSQQQLTSAQADNQRLRDALDTYLAANDPSEFGCACDLSVGHLCGPCFSEKQQRPLREAIDAALATTKGES